MNLMKHTVNTIVGLLAVFCYPLVGFIIAEVNKHYVENEWDWWVFGASPVCAAAAGSIIFFLWTWIHDLGAHLRGSPDSTWW